MSKLDGDGWENSEFPIVCETCLGDNPYVRMTKERFGKECKICARPFTVFRWKPGNNARYKKTEICQTCAKLKNVCQVCVLDLEYGLPVQVRDAALAQAAEAPQHAVNREFMAQQNERRLELGLEKPASEQGPQSDLLLRLAREQPYYKRNQAHLCSFFLKGSCTRGAFCPFLHELPNEDPEMGKQNIKDRFHGKEDPVAKKMMGRYDDMPKLVPPADHGITTLWVGGVDPARITQQAIFDVFYAYGEIKDIRIAAAQRCAFVSYTTREAAELAAERLHADLAINGARLVLRWGRPHSGEDRPAAAAAAAAAAGPAAGAAIPLSVEAGAAMYPSMDPQQLGSRYEREGQ